MTHIEIYKIQKLARPCSANDLFLISQGTQCGNCLAYTSDHGKTWKRADNK